MFIPRPSICDCGTVYWRTNSRQAWCVVCVAARAARKLVLHAQLRAKPRACLDCGWNLRGYVSKAKRCEICQYYFKSEKYRPKRNAAKAREYRKARYAKNAEAFKAYCVAYRNEHPGKAKEAMRLWRQRNPDVVNCGSTSKITLEHVIPLARGGRDEPGNVVPACWPCNASKGAKLLHEWRKSVAIS